MKTLLLAITMITAASPVLAKDVTADGAQATATATTEKPKKVCRTGETPTGSMMAPRRTCKTAEEWAAIDSANAEARTHAAAVAPPQLSMDALTPR